MEVTGKISKFLDKKTGTSKAGKEWVSQSFIVTNNDGYEGKEALYCFDIFGEEKVENLNKFNKVGEEVTVLFSIRTNEYEGKYYTSLSAYRVSKATTLEEGAAIIDGVFEPLSNESLAVVEDDLPF